MKKKWDHDLGALENSLRATYADFLKEETEATKSALFLSIKSLAYSCLAVRRDYKKISMNREEVSYDYGVHLFTRIIKGWRAVAHDGNNFPWQVYIGLNIRNIVFPPIRVNREVLFSNYDEILKEATDVEPSPEVLLQTYEVANKLMISLQLFFSSAEIKRLYPIAREYIPQFLANNKMPEDIRHFLSILSGCLRRVVEDNNFNFLFTPAFNSINEAVFSSVKTSFFLSTLGSDFLRYPQELFLSLDMSSLIRLSLACGGQEIKIPPFKELNDILAVSTALAKMFVEGKTKDEALSEAKKIFKKRSGLGIEQLLERCLAVYHATEWENENSFPSLEKQLLTCSDGLKHLIQQFADSIDKRSLGELVRHFEDITTTLTSIENFLPEEKDES
ncbi:MAG: hypothetical protein DRQ88_05875 [Epsilonproteobacteria bacterium]|nr:MAG: hypothetical protein DRQ88_05875 [Campylobacterota bacterium]